MGSEVASEAPESPVEPRKGCPCSYCVLKAALRDWEAHKSNIYNSDLSITAQKWKALVMAAWGFAEEAGSGI